jgi:anti-sigma regulatory factor (Ser/Thr protein kinase)
MEAASIGARSASGGSVTTDVRVEVPASGEFVHVLRNVVAAVAARSGCGVEVLSDLRLAVDEAVTRLLHDANGADAVIVQVRQADRTVSVTVALRVDPHGWPPPGLEATMSWQILSTLVDGAEASVVDEGPAISFRAPLG